MLAFWRRKHGGGLVESRAYLRLNEDRRDCVMAGDLNEPSVGSMGASVKYNARH